MSVNQPESDGPKPRLTLHYFLAAVPRVLGATIMAVLGFAPLAYLRLADNARMGSPPMDEREAIATVVFSALLAGLPVLITLVIVECQLLLWRAAGWTFNACLVVFPLALAGLGALLALLVFQAPDEPIDVKTRMFALGGAVVLFLAGSFHLWFWQTWYGEGQEATPLGWYIGALWLSSAFLGSMIAWEAPSPFVKAVLEYHGQAWHDRPVNPPMPLPPDSMPPTY